MSMGLDPLRTIRGVGIDQYRAGLGEYLDAVASDAWANGPLAQVGRLAQASEAQLSAEERGESLLSAKDASDEGRELGLRFEAPIARGAFNVLADEKRRQAAAEGVFKRARLEDGYGTLHWLMGGGTEFLVQAADPLNLASAFIPVIGEARAAAMAARIGGFGAAVAKGAVEGAVGQALLEPLAYADRRSLGGDYGMLDTLTSLAFGAGLGVALHGAAYGAGAGFRFIRERFTERPPALTPAAPDVTGRAAPVDMPVLERATDPPPRQPVAEAMETLRPETKDAALRTAVAQLAQDKPVDVEPVLAADPSWREVRAMIREARADIEALQAQSVATQPAPGAVEPPADWQPTAEELRLARRVVRGWTPEPEMQRPTSLVAFVRAAGGLLKDQPEAADLLAQDIGRQPGLLRSKQAGGQSYDDMARRALEQGYAVRAADSDDADAPRFLQMLIEDASGTRKHYPVDSHTEAWRAQQDYFEQFRRGLELAGINPARTGMDARRLAWLLRADPDTARLMNLLRDIDRLDADASAELAWRLEAERVRLEGEMLEADETPGALDYDDAPDHRDLPAATLDELERFYADVERAAGPREAGQEAAGGRPAARAADEGGEARPAGGSRDPAAAEGAGLRRPDGEGAEGTEGAAGDLARWAERQQDSDLHADTDDLGARDRRLTGEAQDAQQRLQDDLKAYGHLLDDDARAVFDDAGRFFDEEAKGIEAMAACRIRGGQ